jgi:hypothetical protein
MIPFWEIIVAIIVTRRGFWKLIGFLLVLGFGLHVIRNFNADVLWMFAVPAVAAVIAAFRNRNVQG